MPLTPLAVDLLRSLPRFAGSDWIFTINGTHPISSFTRPKRKLDEASGVTGWTVHDLRRTGRTLMANLEVPDETAERVLGQPRRADGYLQRIAAPEAKDGRSRRVGGEILRVVGDTGAGDNVIPLRLAS